MWVQIMIWYWTIHAPSHRQMIGVPIHFWVYRGQGQNTSKYPASKLAPIEKTCQVIETNCNCLYLHQWFVMHLWKHIFWIIKLWQRGNGFLKFKIHLPGHSHTIVMSCEGKLINLWPTHITSPPVVPLPKSLLLSGHTEPQRCKRDEKWPPNCENPGGHDPNLPKNSIWPHKWPIEEVRTFWIPKYHGIWKMFSFRFSIEPVLHVFASFVWKLWAGPYV